MELLNRSKFLANSPLRPCALLSGDIAAEMLSTPVHLPLSQRVALLRQVPILHERLHVTETQHGSSTASNGQANPSLSHGAAMKMLLNKNCGAGEALPEEEASTPEERCALCLALASSILCSAEKAEDLVDEATRE
eukprot:6377478-Amphidinium_carterae.1